jgi:hypothetical protein
VALVELVPIDRVVEKYSVRRVGRSMIIAWAEALLSGVRLRDAKISIKSARRHSRLLQEVGNVLAWEIRRQIELSVQVIELVLNSI